MINWSIASSSTTQQQRKLHIIKNSKKHNKADKNMKWNNNHKCLSHETSLFRSNQSNIARSASFWFYFIETFLISKSIPIYLFILVVSLPRSVSLNWKIPLLNVCVQCWCPQQNYHTKLMNNFWCLFFYWCLSCLCLLPLAIWLN